MKTRQELELRGYKFVAWVLLLLFIFSFVFMLVYFFETQDLKTQLSECQENKTIIYKSCITNIAYQPCNETFGYGYYDCSKFKEVENCEVIE